MKKTDSNNTPSDDNGIMCEYSCRSPKTSALPALGIVILVILVIIGGFYAMSYIKKTDKTKINNQTVTEVKIPESKNNESAINIPGTASPSTDKPEKTVEEFYKWYMGYSGNPLTDGAYKSHKSMTNDLIEKIEKDVSKKNGYDPFLCSKNKATGLSIGTPQTAGNFSSVIVSISSANMITLPKVNLQLLNNVWKMVNIACLSTDGALGTIENLKNDAGLTYVITKDSEFPWNSQDYKGYDALDIKGSGFTTTNAEITTNAIKNFFIKKGFTLDSYNTNGYKKGNVVCVYSDKLNSNSKHDVIAECGENK